MKTTIATNTSQLIKARLAAINAAEIQRFDPMHDGAFLHDRVVAANDSLFNQTYLSEPLTNFAVGYKDSTDLEAEVNFLAPPVKVPHRFSYYQANNAEEFFSETMDDERPIRGAFKEVEYTRTEVDTKTVNRGLMMTVDLDQVADKANWQELAVTKLIRRLKRNKHRRAVALLSAAATNTAKTWDTTTGKDPDQDVILELVTAATAAGVAANRVAYGDTAWSKRALSLRAQNSAGGFGSASLTPDSLAGLLGVDGVLRSKARYQSSATAKAEVIGNLVLMFNALDAADVEDSSNIKCFWSPCDGGEMMRVYVQQLTAKLWTVTVEHYELMKITSTLGIRKFTVS